MLTPRFPSRGKFGESYAVSARLAEAGRVGPGRWARSNWMVAGGTGGGGGGEGEAAHDQSNNPDVLPLLG